MNPRISHLVGLLAIIGPQIAVVWQDQQASLENKIALSVVTLLTLLLTDPKKHATAVTLVRAGVAVAALVVAALLTRGTLGTVGTSVATTAIAVFVRLQALLPAKPIDVVKTTGLGGVAVVLVLGALFLAGSAHASPQFGGCLTEQVCAGPSAAITLVSFNLADSTFAGGVSPGVGYGVTFTPRGAPWASVGIDLYASFRLGQDLPNQGAFALMGHFADYLFVGFGPTVTQQPAGESALVQWSILGGLGVPLGGSPKYVEARGAR